jgi:DinB superfamily
MRSPNAGITTPWIPDMGMNFEVSDALPVLARTPGALHALLAGLPPQWTEATEGGDTWSPHTVVGHLVHGERANWIPRATIIREHGTSRPFEPFDRLAQFRESAGKPLHALLEEFATLRTANVALLRSWHLTDEQLALRGLHPEFGPVTLRELLATWVAHDLGHLVQITRVMARQYRDAIGPWKAYLSVMRE